MRTSNSVEISMVTFASKQADVSLLLQQKQYNINNNTNVTRQCYEAGYVCALTVRILLKGKPYGFRDICLRIHPCHVLFTKL